MTFSAYDDVSSTFPMLGISEPLIIIDGRDIGFSNILKKLENNVSLSENEKDIIKRIELENPDCLAYKSHAYNKGANFLFFVKGLKKLTLREMHILG